MKLHKKFLIATIVALAVAALTGVIALADFNDGDLFSNLAISALTATYFCLTILSAAYTLHYRRGKPLAYLCITISLLGFTLTLLAIWAESVLDVLAPIQDFYYFWSILIAAGFLLAGEAAIINLLYLPQKTEWLSYWVRRLATSGLVIIAVIFLDYNLEITGLADIDYPFDEYYIRGGFAVALLTGALALAFPMLLHFERIRREEETATTDLTLRIFCPRCGLDQQINSGQAQCANCKLHINLHLEEPRCSKCNYVLYQMASDCCPECGALIAPKNRWVGPRTADGTTLEATPAKPPAAPPTAEAGASAPESLDQPDRAE